MKEIIAIIRRHKLEETKSALLGQGYSAMTMVSVDGRGKQKGIGGIACELDPALFDLEDQSMLNATTLNFIPKRLISLTVEEKCVEKVVQTIIKVNQSGYIGDGKIFVCPVEEVVRIRTDERGDQALL